MQDFDDSFLSWIWRGIGLAAGFFIFSIIVGLIGLAAMGLLLQGATKELASMMNVPELQASPSSPSSNVRRTTPTAPQRVYVEARSREQCLELTGGVANERYAQCREGYWSRP